MADQPQKMRYKHQHLKGAKQQFVPTAVQRLPANK